MSRVDKYVLAEQNMKITDQNTSLLSLKKQTVEPLFQGRVTRGVRIQQGPRPLHVTLGKFWPGQITWQSLASHRSKLIFMITNN